LTGSRIEATAQFRVGNCSGGAFNICKDKTKTGTRRIPIHSGLIALVERRCAKKSPTDWLFPERSQRDTGERSMAVSKRFGTYRVRLGVDDRRGQEP